MSALFSLSKRLECMKFIVFFGLFFLSAFGLRAQVVDTLQTPGADSLSEKKTFSSWLTDSYPNPKRALLFSLFPGGGQAYNKAWWKIPIVYGALGGMIYLIDRNSTDYLYFKRAYRRKVRGLPHDLSGQGGLDSSTALKRYRDQADKNTQLSYIGFVAVYGLAGLESFVDGHLSSFDVSDDLSLKWGPKELGIGLTLEF
ncbi:MAG: hypothetical protein IPL49_14765 [Saprospirales bacterium]|nr:hypothetical protein [Saprospirales bacterium]MBK8492104.1 hypothetical protein [Saprospirales bacterium]